MRNRSNLLVLLGIAFFVVGGIIVYVLTSDDDEGGSTPVGAQPITVVVASQDIPANTKATDAIEQGWVEEAQIPTGALLAGAVQSLTQLQGATFIQDFTEGSQILTTGLQQVTRGYELPEGFEAVAIQMNFPQGGAGYVQRGDKINLYGALTASPVPDGTLPHAELMLSNVRVLDTNQTIPSNTTSNDPTARPGGGQLTFLLAVKTSDAEKLIYLSSFEQLYATLVREDAPPATTLDGIDGENLFSTDPALSAA